MLPAVIAAQTALDAWLAAMPEHDPAAPSRLPGWTLGHVLTHLARNADSQIRMLSGQPQYPDGAAQRDGDIAAGAARPWGELLADLAAAQAALADFWPRVDDWSLIADQGVRPRPYAQLPLIRWREVEVHRADLGLGYTFADMPGEYVRRDLVLLTMRFRATRPIGLTQLPPAAATLPPATRLAWLMGRTEIDGLAPADVF